MCQVSGVRRRQMQGISVDSTRQNQPAAVAVGSHHFCRGEVLRLAIDEGTFQGDRTFYVSPRG